jgi:hypothetical protein
MVDDRTFIIQWWTVLLGGLICLATVELIRRDLLRTAYALIWLASGLAIALIGFFSSGFFFLVQKYSGMLYQTFILFCVLSFAIILLMQFSILISRLSDRNKRLTQDVAILQEELRQQRSLPAGQTKDQLTGPTPQAPAER